MMSPGNRAMGRSPRRTCIMAGILAVCLMALGAVAALPWLFRLQGVQERLAHRLSDMGGWAVSYESADLDLLPRPAITFHRAAIRAGDSLTGTLPELTVSLRLWPILRGRLYPARIHLGSLSLKLSAPSRPGGRPRGLDRWLLRLARFLRALPERLPAEVITVTGGRLDLSWESADRLRVTDIEARLHSRPEGLSWELEGVPEGTRGLSIKGGMEGGSLSLETHLSGFQAEQVFPKLLLQRGFHVASSSLEVDLRLRTHGRSAWSARYRGRLNQAVLLDKGRRIPLGPGAFEGHIEKAASRWEAVVDTLTLQAPALTLQGRLGAGHDGVGVRAELSAEIPDLEALGRTLTTLLPRQNPAAKVFGVLRGGRVTDFRAAIETSTWSRLGRLQDWHLEGVVSDGHLWVPGLKLELDGVAGPARIETGLLSGENLKARWDGRQIRAPRFRLGLSGPERPLLLDATLSAGVEPILNLLGRSRRTRPLVERFFRWGRPRGVAGGHLRVEGSLRVPRVQATITELDLRLERPNLPGGLKLAGGAVTLKGQDLLLDGLDLRLGQSKLSGVHGRLSPASDQMNLNIGGGRLVIEEILSLLGRPFQTRWPGLDIRSAAGRVRLESASLRGPLSGPSLWKIRMRGQVDTLTLRAAELPEPLAFSSGTFEARNGGISFSGVRLRSLDTTLQLSGNLRLAGERLQRVELTVGGSLSQAGWEQLTRFAPWLRPFTPAPPIRTPGIRLAWQERGPFSVQGPLQVGGGMRIRLDVFHQQGMWLIRDFSLQDQESQASLAFQFGNGTLGIQFQGHISKRSFEKIHTDPRLPGGWAQGDFKAWIPAGALLEATFEGKLEGGHLILSREGETPLSITTVSLLGKGKAVDIRSLVFQRGERRITLTGSLAAEPAGLQAEMDLASNGLEWRELQELWTRTRAHARGNHPIRLRGRIHVTSEYLLLGGLTWSGLDADLLLGDPPPRLMVRAAEVCGISTPGTVLLQAGGPVLDLRPGARNADLDKSLTCLADRGGLMSGSFDLSGALELLGSREALLSSLAGELRFEARDGRLYRLTPLARALAFLNLTELLVGKVPELKAEGLAYSRMQGVARLDQGRVRIQESRIEGRSVEVACTGEVDLVHRTLELKLLVAPLKTVDRLVKSLPGIRDILGGTLLSVPLRVSGPWEDLRVTALAPADIGAGLLGILKRVVTVPLEKVKKGNPAEEAQEGR